MNKTIILRKIEINWKCKTKKLVILKRAFKRLFLKAPFLNAKKFSKFYKSCQ